MTCPRCKGDETVDRAHPDGISRRCATCGYPVLPDVGKRPADLMRVHDLLNARATPKPLANTCHSCGSEVRDARLCMKCMKNVKRWLASVAESLSDELDVTIARQSRFADEGQRVTGTATPPLPLHVDASEARDDLRAKLVSWVKFCEEEA